MLSQSDADNMITEEKEFDSQNLIEISSKNGRTERLIISKFSKNQFLMTINPSSIRIEKVTYQSRLKQENYVLLRLDTSGPRHMNPDGQFVEYPHIHIYKEGFNDKWAYPLDESIFTNINRKEDLLRDFLNYFHVDSKSNPQIIFVDKII